MIYTCTFNPSLDYILTLDDQDLHIGSLNRSKEAVINPGGKGINVSILLSNLGVENTLFGFIAGFTGQYLLDLLKEKPFLNLRFIEVDGLTRINVKLKGKQETEINAPGPLIQPMDYQRMLDRFRDLTPEDFVILSGSAPRGCENLYSDVASILHRHNIPFVVDANKCSLLSTLRYHPLLIKPNIYELEDIFNVKINSLGEVIAYGEEARKLGAQNVLISLGEEGSILVSEQGIYRANVPKGELIHSIGAGDSMVAGFVYKYQKTHDLIQAYHYAAACGSATAYSPGIASQSMINKLLDEIDIQRIEATTNENNEPIKYRCHGNGFESDNER